MFSFPLHTPMALLIWCPVPHLNGYVEHLVPIRSRGVRGSREEGKGNRGRGGDKLA